jgi:hypothetical protein
MHTLFRLRDPSGQPLGTHGDHMIAELAWLRPHCLAVHEDGVVLALAGNDAYLGPWNGRAPSVAALVKQTIEAGRRGPLEVATWHVADQAAVAMVGTISVSLLTGLGATIAPSLEWDVARSATRRKPSSLSLL